MFGAVIGDMAGSPYEFEVENKRKDIDLFTDKVHFTDDTVMTAAVAEALLKVGPDAEPEKIRGNVADAMMTWGHRYPDAGYGVHFQKWLTTGDPKPYNSCGNGAAMRVSAAGWLYDSLDRTREAARATAEATHNHPEGIKGAESVASVVYLARTGSQKEEIREYVTKEFGYDLTRTCDEIRPDYAFDETCQGTVPEAITAFLEGKDFEDVIRTAASLGGDCDTLTCIAGSMAEAMYPIPEWMIEECSKRLPDDLKGVMSHFYHVLKRMEPKRHPEDPVVGNVFLEDAIAGYRKNPTNENLAGVLACIRRRIEEQGNFLIPVEIPSELLSKIDPATVKAGDTIQLDEEVHLIMRRIQTKDGQSFMAAFTGKAEMEKGQTSSTVSQPIKDFLTHVYQMQSAAGVVINPWSDSIVLNKPMLELVLRDDILGDENEEEQTQKEDQT